MKKISFQTMFFKTRICSRHRYPYKTYIASTFISLTSLTLESWQIIVFIRIVIKNAIIGNVTELGNDWSCHIVGKSRKKTAFAIFALLFAKEQNHLTTNLEMT